MNRTCFAILLLASLFSLVGCIQDTPINGLSQYQKLDSVSNFAPNLSIEGTTFKGSFSDDYNTFYFFRKETPGVEKYVPYTSQFENGEWQAPKIAGYYNDTYSYTYQLKVPGTDALFFLSNQKTKNDTSTSPNYNFWKTEIANGALGKPKEFEYESLIYNYNSQPSITNDGTLFFTSDTPDWSKTLSYKMELHNGTYSEPELFEPLNSWRNNKDWAVYEFCVSPNKDYIIVCIQDNTNDSPSADLYLSRMENGNWSYPQRIGHGINSPETENFPYITPNGKYLLFTKAFSEFKIVPIKMVLDI